MLLDFVLMEMAGVSGYIGTTADASTDSVLKAITTGKIADRVDYQQTVSFGAEDKMFQTTVTLSNNTGDPIYNANYIRKFDPDQNILEDQYITDDYFFKDTNDGVWVVASVAKLTADADKTLRLIENHKEALEKVKNPFVFYTDDLRAQAVYGPIGIASGLDGRGTEIYKKHIYADKAIGIEFLFPVINAGESVTFTYQSSLNPDFDSAQEDIENLKVNITKQPAFRTYEEGKIKGKLVVEGQLVIDGTPVGSEDLQYQWYTNTTGSNEGGEPISGANLSSFEIPKDLAAGSISYYYCVVSASIGELSDQVSSMVGTVQVAAPGTAIYKVTFDKNLEAEVGNMPAVQTIPKDSPLFSITDPILTGKKFLGWFTEKSAAGEKKWNVESPVKGDMTLYAGWFVDTEKPKIKDITGNPESWVSADQTITFKATDDGEVTKVTVAKDGGAKVELSKVEGKTDTYSFTTGGNGKYNITAQDAANNEVSETVEVTKIDLTVPELTISGDTESYKSEDKVTITPTDTESSIAKVEVKVGEKAYQDITETYKDGYMVTSNGTYTFKASNGAGATAEKSLTYTKINVTSAKPEITEITGNPESWVPADQTITFKATDDIGIASVTLTKDGTAVDLVAGADSTYSFVTIGNGNYVITAMDIEGQAATFPVNVVHIDITPPTIAVAGDVENYKSSDTVIITPTVGVSGITKVQVQTEDGNFQDITASYQGGYVVSANGTYTFQVTNGAGVTAESAITYTKIDSSVLAITGVVDGYTYYVDRTVIVTGENLASIKVNDVNFENGAKIEGNVDQVYTIIAENLAGTKTTCTVTMKTINSILTPIEGITGDTIVIEDRAKLEDMKKPLGDIDITNASDNQKGEITEAQKKIDDLLTTLNQVKDVEDIIQSLPQPEAVTKDDAGKIKEALDGLNQLTDHQKNLVDGTLKTKLDQVAKALRKLSVPDESTGSVIEGVDGTDFDINTKLEVKLIEDNEIKGKYAENVIKATNGKELVDLFDIKLILNGEEIQPEGKVKITLQLNDALSKYKDLQAVYIADDGSVTLIPSTVEGSTIWFITDHFSYYGVVGTPLLVAEQEKPENPENPDQPKSPEQSAAKAPEQAKSQVPMTSDSLNGELFAGIMVIAVAIVVVAGWILVNAPKNQRKGRMSRRR